MIIDYDDKIYYREEVKYDISQCACAKYTS